MRTTFVSGLALTLLAAAALAQTTASKPAPSTQPLPDYVRNPPAGLKLQRVEQDNTGKALAPAIADEITLTADGLVNTKGLADLGMPAVKITVSPGNATNFYRGTASLQDGGQVAWQWGVPQFTGPNNPPPKFRASVTRTSKDGKQTLWILTQSD